MSLLARNAAAKAVLTITLGISTGCGDSERTRSEQVKSPDGRFVATAETLEFGSWGTASPPETHVDVNWTSGSQESTNVFSFDGPYEPGGARVGMHWLTPTHLELTYKGKPTITFQAIKWVEVEISVRPESSAAVAIKEVSP